MEKNEASRSMYNNTETASGRRKSLSFLQSLNLRRVDYRATAESDILFEMADGRERAKRKRRKNSLEHSTNSRRSFLDCK